MTSRYHRVATGNAKQNFQAKSTYNGLSVRPTSSDRLEKVLINGIGVETMQNTCFIYFFSSLYNKHTTQRKKETKALKICHLTFS